MCHVFDKETLLNIEAVVKGAPNYPKRAAQKPKEAIFPELPETVSQACKELSDLEKKINQVFEKLKGIYV